MALNHELFTLGVNTQSVALNYELFTLGVNIQSVALNYEFFTLGVNTQSCVVNSIVIVLSNTELTLNLYIDLTTLFLFIIVGL